MYVTNVEETPKEVVGDMHVDLANVIIFRLCTLFLNQQVAPFDVDDASIGQNADVVLVVEEPVSMPTSAKIITTAMIPITHTSGP